MTFLVADLYRNQLDSAGVMVEQIYVKVDTLYAVYRTEERVVVQFADDQAQGADQRKSFAELSTARSAIDSLLDEVRDTRDPSRLTRARRYERRLANALTLGLQGQTNQAGVELDALQQALVEERRSGARQAYLAASVAVGAVLILLIAILSSPLFNFGLAGDRLAVATNMWFAAAVGTVGALFSTVLAIRGRAIEPSISIRDTVVDAGLRTLVGALSGALVFVLIKVSAFGVQIGSAQIDSKGFETSSGWLYVLLAAFLAGFLERLVPDLLAKASASEVKDAKPGISTRSAAQDAASSETNPLGEAKGGSAAGAATDAPSPADDPADDSGEDVEDCCSRPSAPELLTQDVELPEAVGGVEAR